MSPFKRLKASVVKENQEASEVPSFLIELDCTGNLVAAYQGDNLLSKAHGLELAKGALGEGKRVTKTFKDYDGRVEYGDVIQYSIPQI